MDLAKKLSCADEYVELDRQNPQEQWDALKKAYPYGFDAVVGYLLFVFHNGLMFNFEKVEATGSIKVVQDSLNYVRKGGTLLLYSIYDSEGLVQWSPMKIFTEEISVSVS
jgi:D-arabinitol dehydrogenase (NADP+)